MVVNSLFLNICHVYLIDTMLDSISHIEVQWNSRSRAVGVLQRCPAHQALDEYMVTDIDTRYTTMRVAAGQN